MGSHAAFLQLQGQEKHDVDAIGTGKIDEAKLTPAEKVMLEYVKKLTLEPAKMTDALTQKMRDVGWTDDQIFETAFITSLFAFFNRMADAYGLDYPTGRWFPPDSKDPRAKLPMLTVQPGAQPPAKPPKPPKK